MKALVARIAVVVLLILATPAVTFARDETVWWDWFVRLITWGSGGWHGF